MWLEFLLTSLVVVIAPGTGVIYTISVGLSSGGMASVAAAAGCTLGILPAMTAAILGLAALFQISPLAFDVLKYFGVAYLLYLAWMMIRHNGPLEIFPERNKRAFTKIALSGFLINILNPKLSIFFLAFLPQFIPTNSNTPTQLMVAMSAIFMAMTFIVFVGYGTFATYLRGHLLAHPRAIVVMNALFALIFVALSIRLAIGGA